MRATVLRPCCTLKSHWEHKNNMSCLTSHAKKITVSGDGTQGFKLHRWIQCIAKFENQWVFTCLHFRLGTSARGGRKAGSSWHGPLPSAGLSESAGSQHQPCVRYFTFIISFNPHKFSIKWVVLHKGKLRLNRIKCVPLSVTLLLWVLLEENSASPKSLLRHLLSSGNCFSVFSH